MRPVVVAVVVAYHAGEPRARITLDLHPEDVHDVLDSCDGSELAEGGLALVRELGDRGKQMRADRLAGERAAAEPAPPPAPHEEPHLDGEQAPTPASADTQ